MKVSELLSVYEAFKALSEKELPFSAALTVAENMDILKLPFAVADKKKNAIISDSIEKDENGQPISTGNNTYKLRTGNTFEMDMSALMEEEVDINELKNLERTQLEAISIEPKTLLPIREYIM